MSNWTLWTNFSEIVIKIQNFSFTKRHLKISSAKWRSFWPGGGVLISYSWGYIQSGNHANQWSTMIVTLLLIMLLYHILMIYTYCVFEFYTYNLCLHHAGCLNVDQALRVYLRIQCSVVIANQSVFKILIMDAHVLLCYLTHWRREKWTPFSRRHFQMHFLQWKCTNFYWNFTEVCS